MARVAVISCGLGNVQSLCDALRRIGAFPIVCHNRENLMAEPFDRIFLPGVGAVSYYLKNLRAFKLDQALAELVIGQKVPFLGICVGMQVLATESHEFDLCYGLNFIPGKVEKICVHDQNTKLPHVGWNDVNYARDGILYESLNGKEFYFVHSYCFNCPPKYALAYTNHGQQFVSIVSSENIFGVQFHPEKSSRNGEILLQNFVEHGRL